MVDCEGSIFNITGVIMFGWGKKTSSNHVSGKAAQKPKDLLDGISNENLIQKLLELPWVETRSGVPGLLISALDEAQGKLLYTCNDQGVVHFMSNSNSLGAPAFYSYNPTLVAALAKKEGFITQDENAESKAKVRKYIIEKIPEMADLMAKHGTRTMDKGVATKLRHIDVEDVVVCNQIKEAYESRPEGSHLHLRRAKLTDGDKISGRHYVMDKDTVGPAIAGHIYLTERGIQQAQGQART